MFSKRDAKLEMVLIRLSLVLFEGTLMCVVVLIGDDDDDYLLHDLCALKLFLRGITYSMYLLHILTFTTKYCTITTFFSKCAAMTDW